MDYLPSISYHFHSYEFPSKNMLISALLSSKYCESHLSYNALLSSNPNQSWKCQDFLEMPGLWEFLVCPPLATPAGEFWEGLFVEPFIENHNEKSFFTGAFQKKFKSQCMTHKSFSNDPHVKELEKYLPLIFRVENGAAELGSWVGSDVVVEHHLGEEVMLLNFLVMFRICSICTAGLCV